MWFCDKTEFKIRRNFMLQVSFLIRRLNINWITLSVLIGHYRHQKMGLIKRQYSQHKKLNAGCLIFNAANASLKI